VVNDRGIAIQMHFLMNPPRIVSAQAVDDRTLVVKFTNQGIRKYEVSRLVIAQPRKSEGFSYFATV